MKAAIFLAGLFYVFCLLTTAKAGPLNGATVEAEEANRLIANLAVENPESLKTLSRQKRFTCDFLESTDACIFHCLLLGRRGGYCSRQKVCICRQ